MGQTTNGLELRMFENFSIPARRIVFWARLEAGRSGSDLIEPEHFLIGLLTEDQADWRERASYLGVDRMKVKGASPSEPFFSGEVAEKLRQILAQSTPPGVPKPDALDMPLGEKSKRALIAAQERAGNSTVRMLHVLWGLMTDRESSVSHLLKSNGITVKQIEEAIENRLKRAE